eukprot:5484023-Pyramimonas_sp.AAC.2
MDRAPAPGSFPPAVIVAVLGVLQAFGNPRAHLSELELDGLDSLDEGSMHRRARDCNWQKAFEEHKFRHLPGDDRMVYPMALYCDGVRYTRAAQ